MSQLFQNAKIQDLNVIHNHYMTAVDEIFVVSECKDTRFECNSQPLVPISLNTGVVSECKDTRFECNSQLMSVALIKTFCCFRMQRYKI